MSRQWEAVAALRERAETVAGWNTDWPVAYAKQPFDTPTDRQWLEEEIQGGPGEPEAVTAPNTVWVRFTGRWQLLLKSPPEGGEKIPLDFLEAIAFALITPAIALDDGTPVLVLGTDVNPTLTTDGDAERALVVTYQFTVPVTSS